MRHAAASKLARNSLWSRPLPHGGLVHCRRQAAAAGRAANPVTLASRSCTVHLLGTMHIAEASAVAARELIEREHAAGRLGSVFLELDDDRYGRLVQAPEASDADESLLAHALGILSRAGRSPAASLFELGLGTMYRALHRLGFASGVEFRAAIAAAKRADVPLVLGDQHIRVTLARVAEAFPRDFSVAKALAFLGSSASAPESHIERDLRDVFQDMAAGRFDEGQKKLEKLIDRDSARQLVAPLRSFAPSVAAAILDERDGIMAANLLTEAHKRPGKSIVAVVGMAHVDGIVERWNVISN